jgi:anaerobic selenocysteine-containing dehydrogenase
MAVQTTNSVSEILPSVCPLDCPDTCSLNVEIQNDTIIGVRGSKANPYTEGVICNKVVRSYPQMVHGAGRLTRPLKRSGPRNSGQYEEITWDEAIDLVHDGFQRAISQYGPQSVLPFNYAGPHGELAGGSMDRRFFYKLGASLLDRGPLCGGVRGTAYNSLFGPAPGMPPEQAIHSDLIVIWGNNVTVSNLHFIRVINRAKAGGATIVVIDPKKIKVAEQADLHIQIQPGTDVVLAMAIAAELERINALDVEFIEKWTTGFEQFMHQARQYSVQDAVDICRISRKDFDRLVELYAKCKTIGASFGNGIERGKSGGSGLRAAMALQALTGNHGRSGAGVIAKSGLAAPKTTDRLQMPELVPPGTRTLNIVDLGDKLLDLSLDPPIMALMIYNHNPVCTHPDQGRMIEALSREDLFIAGCDIVMTDSMKFADVILPAASHFEYDDIYGAYGQNYVQRAKPVISPVGESLPNTEIFRRLARRFGFMDEIFNSSDQELIDSAFDGERLVNGMGSPSQIEVDKALEIKAEYERELIMCDSVLPATKSGKIELFSRELEEKYGYGVPRYEPVPQSLPFILISPSSDKRTNATFGGCDESEGMETVEINPIDAGELGIGEADMVELVNERSTVILRAKISESVKQGVCYSPKGTWLKSSPTGRTVNALISADIRTDIADGACYHETFVDIRLH